jgi:hypothetical protein
MIAFKVSLGNVICKNSSDLLKFAKLFLVEYRLKLLEYDVNRCLPKENNG